MKRWMKAGILGLLVLGALAVVVSGTVLAQEETPEPQTEGWPYRGKGFGRGLGGEVALEAAAEALGMTTEELSDRLWAGESLADLAEEAGVELSDLRAAVEAAQLEATREAIEQAVEDGSLTRDHADWLLEGLENGYWNGFGGHGGFHRRGFGGFGGPGGFMPPPEVAPDSSSDGA